MSFVLNSSIIGPGWVAADVGDFTRTFDQYWSINPDKPGWRPTIIITADRLVIRPGANYRRPLSWRAHLAAMWSARGTIWKRLVLRRPAFPGDKRA